MARQAGDNADDHRIGSGSGRRRNIGEIPTTPAKPTKQSSVGPCGKVGCKGDCDTCAGAAAADTAKDNKFGGMTDKG